jgi:hypothetical protein
MLKEHRRDGMQVFYAHEHPQLVDPNSLFAGGPSPRGREQLNWRPEFLAILEEIGYKGQVFIPLPRERMWDAEYEDQKPWELQYLKAVTVIAFWMPRSEELRGMTSNVEFGLFAHGGKVVLGYPEEAEHMGYLRYIADVEAHIPVAHTMRATIDLSLALMVERNLRCPELLP